MRATAGWIAVSIVVAFPSHVEGQHPGYLGKRVAPARVRAKPVPTWPRKVDPEPLRTSQYLDLHLALIKNRVKVIKLAKGTFASGPKVLKRFRGRFEARLFTAGLLIDTVRFDFPLTGGASTRSGRGDGLGVALSKGVSAKTRVRVPFDGRITRVMIVDTRTKKKVPVDLSPVGVRPKVKPKVRSDLRTNVFRFGLTPAKATAKKTDKGKGKGKGKGKAKGKGKGLGNAKIFGQPQPSKRPPPKGKR
jgi:hypothetical protein